MSGHQFGRDLAPEKGKGKAIAATPASDAPGDEALGTGTGEAYEAAGVQHPAAAGFTSRLADSAVHLSQSLLTSRPETAELARLSSAGGTKAESSAFRQREGAGESSSAIARSGARAVGAGGALRASAPTEADKQAAQSEADFSAFLDGTSVSVPSERSGLDGAWYAAPGRGPISEAPASSIAEQEVRDGLEVVDLLARPEAEFEPEPEEYMTAKEASALRSALFGTESAGSSSVDWDNLLNFIPDFVRPDPGGASGSASAVKSAESLAVIGMPHGQQAEKAWLDQWMGVLTAYNEQVWGDLGSLVHEAKEEIRKLEDLPEGEARPEATAVRRLQQILGHIRGF